MVQGEPAPILKVHVGIFVDILLPKNYLMSPIIGGQEVVGVFASALVSAYESLPRLKNGAIATAEGDLIFLENGILLLGLEFKFRESADVLDGAVNHASSGLMIKSDGCLTDFEALEARNDRLAELADKVFGIQSYTKKRISPNMKYGS